MFQLTKQEARDCLKSQFATLKRGEHSKYLPYVFTEQGVAMLSSVLNSEKAIQANIDCFAPQECGTRNDNNICLII